MKPETPGCSGIEVQHVSQCLVAHDSQDVRMTANEKIGWIFTNSFRYGAVVSAWIATDMSHPNVNALDLKAIVLRM